MTAIPEQCAPASVAQNVVESPTRDVVLAETEGAIAATEEAITAGVTDATAARGRQQQEIRPQKQ